MELKDLDIKADLVKEFIKLLDAYKKLNTTRELLKAFKEVKEVSVTNTSLNHLEELNKSYLQIRKHKKEATEAKNKMLAAKEVLEATELELTKFKACPLCGSTLEETEK